MLKLTALFLISSISCAAFAVETSPPVSRMETVQPVVQSYGEYLRTHKALLDPMRPAYETGVVLVKVAPNVTPVVEGAATFGVRSVDAVLSSYGAYRIAHAFGPVTTSPKSTAAAASGNALSRIYRVYYVATNDPIDVAERIALDPAVEFAEPSPIRYTLCNATEYGGPGDNTTYQIERLHVDGMWALSTAVCDATNVVIAIVDSGVDLTHSELKDILWENPTAGTDGVQNDFHGVDLVGNVSNSQANSGQFIPDGDPSPGHEHGTHVSGDADAMCNGGGAACGPAFNCPIMAIKCGTNDPNSGSVYQGYAGIQWAVTHGASVINCSWGGPGISQTEQSVIDYAFDQNIVVVVAAGNSTNNNDINAFGPASLSRLLSVGATDYKNGKDIVAYFSDFGTSVRTWAPGTNIWNSLPTNQGTYGYLSGTSMASPIVAGVAAFLRKMNPDASADEIVERIHVYSRLPLDMTDKTKYYGMLDAYQAAANDSLWPGVVVTGTQASAASDTVPMQVTLKNWLNPSDNLQGILSFATPNPNLMIKVNGSRANYGKIPTKGSLTRSFPLILLNGATRVVAKFNLHILDGKYDDYLTFTATVTHSGAVSWNANTAVSVPLLSVKGVTDNIAWAAGGDGNAQTGSVYNTVDGTQWNQVVTPGLSNPESRQTHYCIDALNGADGAQRVWLGTATRGGHNASVFYGQYSDSAGKYKWTGVDVSAITPFVDAIHFFNVSNGVMIGDPLNGRWGIAQTTDGGHTWNPLATAVAAGVDTAWNNAADWVGASGWFGASQSEIYKTTDGGNTWASRAMPFAATQGIAFSNTATGIAFSNSSASGTGQLARSWDGGNTWGLIAGPAGASNPRYAGIAYAKGAPNVWVCGTNYADAAHQTPSGDFVYVSHDNGRTWTQQTVTGVSSATFGPNHLALGFNQQVIAGKADMEGWAVGGAIVDYYEYYTVGVHDAALPLAPNAADLTVFPNPAPGRALLRATLAERARMTSLKVYDAIGRVVADLTQSATPTDARRIQALFDCSALPDGLYHAVLWLSDGTHRETGIVKR